jgi:hypothetical protein
LKKFELYEEDCESLDVIPAQAGIHLKCSAERINAWHTLKWIPACAGMTVLRESKPQQTVVCLKIGATHFCLPRFALLETHTTGAT